MNNNGGTVNDQLVDAVTQMNTLVLGTSAPQSLSLVDVAGAETLGMSMYNAVASQQNSQISASASVTAACAKMLQAQIPLKTEAKPSASSTPPPFMPLNPDSKGSASDLITQASTLANSAMELLKKNQQQGNDNDAELNQLISTLQGYVKDKSGSNENQSASTSTPTASESTSSTSPNPSSGSDGETKKA